MGTIEKAKDEQQEKLAAIEKKAVKICKAIDVLSALDDGKTKAITDCVALLNAQLSILEKTAAALVTSKFAQMRKK